MRNSLKGTGRHGILPVDSHRDDDGLYLSVYQTERYKGSRYIGTAAKSKTGFAVNVILTSTEKAFHELDADTKIERQLVNFS